MTRHEEMQATAHDFWLEAGLAIERNEAVIDRAAKTPELFENAEPVVGDIADHAAPPEQDCQHDERDGDFDRLPSHRAQIL